MQEQKSKTWYFFIQMNYHRDREPPCSPKDKEMVAALLKLPAKAAWLA